VLRTYRVANESVRASIRDVYTAQGVEQRAARLREVCDLSPGVEYAMARAAALVAGARARLQTLEPSPAREALASLGDFVLERRW
jgi:geranylgeranyl pyrophosphate synthase